MLSSFILSSCLVGFAIAILVADNQNVGTPQSDGFGGEFEFLNYGTCYIDPLDTRILAVSFSWVTGVTVGYALGSVFISNVFGLTDFDEDSFNDFKPSPLATITASFHYNIPLTYIINADTVTQYATFGNGVQTLQAEYTLYQSPMIISTALTSVVPITSPNASPPIIFTLGTVTSIGTSTASPTTTVTKFIGTSTIYVIAPTVIKTHTITPPPYIHTDYKIEITTTTPSCIPSKPNHKRHNAVHAVNVLIKEVHLAAPLLNWILALFKRGTVTSTKYGTPSCGAYDPVIVYTLTVISNPIVFTTPSITIPATTTVTMTVPSLTTATSYSNILSTTTVTP